LRPWAGSGGGGQAGDLVPGDESGVHLAPVLGRGASVAAGPEVPRYPTERGQEPLRAALGSGSFASLVAAPGWADESWAQT